MKSTDPIADLLTKMRNASQARHRSVDVPASRLAERLLAILQREGFIRAFKPVGQAPRGQLRVYLKYGSDKSPAIVQLVRVSKPGLRSYCGVGRLPRVLGGLGRVILTTSKGLMTDQEAKRQRLGGEILCYVW